MAGMARLGIPGLALLAVAGFAGLMDTAFLLGVISAYAEHLGASKAEAGFIAGLYSMVAIPASALAGLIVDKVGRKRALSLGLAWDTASLVLYSQASTPTQLAVVRGLHAVGGSLVYPALFAMVGDAIPRSRIGFGSGTYLAIIGASVALGSYMGGRVAEALGFDAALMMLAAVLAIGFMASLPLPETLAAKRVSSSGGEVEIDSARGDVRKALGAAAIIASLYIGFGVIVGGLPTSLTGEGIAASEEASAGLTGMTIGLATLASLPAFLAAGRALDARKPLKPLTLAAALAVIGAYALASLESPQSLAIFAILYGPIIGVGMTSSTYLAVTAGASRRGKALAAQQIANILGIAVGAPLGGILSQELGLDGIALGVVLSVLLVLASAVIFRGMMLK